MKRLLHTSLFLICCSPIAAEVLRVPQDVPTIQTGLNVISNFDTLLVSYGIYEEALVARSYWFTLLGELGPTQEDTLRPIIDASELNIADTTAVLRLQMNCKLVIENFEFRNRSGNGIRSWADSVVLRNCVLDSHDVSFEQVLRDSAATIVIENCRLTNCVSRCAIARSNSSVAASHTLFSTNQGPDLSMVVVGPARFDSCEFRASSRRSFMTALTGPHEIRDCVFGPATGPTALPMLEILSGSVTLSGNYFTECFYGSNLIELSSTLGDSVDIVNNTFDGCRGIIGGHAAQGVVKTYTTGAAERGVLIRDNIFIGCAGIAFTDDIALGPFAPASVTSNEFVSTAVNGLPSVAVSPNVFQPTPATIDSNSFDACGYALSARLPADARFNYWGHNSGPFHAITNPFGQGDTITGDVPFIPWLEDSTDATELARHEVPHQISLSVFPNPFNAKATISFELDRSSTVELVVFDVLGREVQTIMNEPKNRGAHHIEFNGAILSSGIYFIRLTTPYRSTTTKLLALK